MVVFHTFICAETLRETLTSSRWTIKTRRGFSKLESLEKTISSTLSLVQVHVCWFTLKPRSNCSAQSCSFTPAQYQVSSRALHEGPLAKREKEAAFISPAVAAAALGQKKTHISFYWCSSLQHNSPVNQITLFQPPVISGVSDQPSTVSPSLVFITCPVYRLT